MNILSQIVGALVEAWGEVRVQKARVILSLVGVVAAVAAMSTVIALGDIVGQADKEMNEAFSGRDITLRLMPQKTGDDGGDNAGASPGGGMVVRDGGVVAYAENAATDADSSEPEAQDQQGWSDQATGVVSDPVSTAMKTLADRFAIPYWSRLEDSPIQIDEVDRAQQTGSFRGAPVVEPKYGFAPLALQAVDPNYQVLFRLKPIQGRWLQDSDVNQRVSPVVINSVLWEYLGEPSIADPIVLNVTGKQTQQLRVVGVVRAKSAWDQPVIYMHYDAWQLTKPREATDPMMGDMSSMVPTMLVWSGEDQVDQARTELPAAMSAILGQGWRVDVSGGEQFESAQDQTQTLRLIVMIIGAIVISLGALGLLNVAIVTVRQRIREIGIRRAMGASAGRVFFAVFMESVVATFVAGLIGVGIAIVVLQFLPLESMDIMLQDRPTFPTSAATAGVGIASAVGALCGIIPAVAAVRVRPIDAIRY
ncbi:MAG: ABC transporter permease [Actinomyces sp.]|nr:ABC transporter permease [Actinomyces sp.]